MDYLDITPYPPNYCEDLEKTICLKHMEKEKETFHFLVMNYHLCKLQKNLLMDLKYHLLKL